MTNSSASPQETLHIVPFTIDADLPQDAMIEMALNGAREFAEAMLGFAGDIVGKDNLPGYLDDENLGAIGAQNDQDRERVAMLHRIGHTLILGYGERRLASQRKPPMRVNEVRFKKRSSEVDEIWVPTQVILGGELRETFDDAGPSLRFARAAGEGLEEYTARLRNMPLIEALTSLAFAAIMVQHRFGLEGSGNFTGRVGPAYSGEESAAEIVRNNQTLVGDWGSDSLKATVGSDTIIWTITL